jgi:AraC-like DNA-binding protein
MHHDRGSFTIRASALLGAHAVEAHSAYSFPRHAHDEYGMGLIVSGAQRSWSGRGRVEAARDDMITCNPGEVHDGAPIGEARAWKMLYLSPALVAACAADIREGRGSSFEFELPVMRDRTLVRMFEAAYRALTMRGRDAAYAEERLLLLLARVRAREQSAAPALPAALARAKARIDDDPLSPLTLSELAREADVSRYRLVRGFAGALGVTPHAYLLQRRVGVARRMIALGTPLATAAADCGFADQSHFTRVYARLYGHPPGQFARAMNAARRLR